ncbi:glycosyltransferase [uncultured Piscinibacter sp.]|uniref:glycosyltransferase n=1 Tax=uncultured Piscinibacter sp. TaxID=1131835 RepID=UPI0026209D5B|nr:glycosyltransferase [uncultured Piscinibacter sp.]
MMRVVHVTTVHPRDDIRIFRKECVSLAKAGHEVVQVVGDGLGDAQVDGVRIVDIGARPAGRLARMRVQPARALAAVRALAPALVHVHDPELLPLAAAMARGGVPAIYDAHEDVPRQILTKQWIPAALRGTLSRAFERYENARVRRLAAVVAATPHIARRFAAVARRSVTVANYPFPEELAPPDEAVPRERAVCYVGGIMRTRGALEMVRAVAQVPGMRLLLAGRFEDAVLEAALTAEPGWAQVEYLGQVGREEVRRTLSRARAGLVTLLPMPSYVDSLPIKMFEYMSAGLPVIASDFPLWRDIVVRHGCGVCVDATDVAAIAGAIRRIVDAPQAVQAMGEAGRAAVQAHYRWSSAEAELLALYEELLR